MIKAQTVACVALTIGFFSGCSKRPESRPVEGPSPGMVPAAGHITEQEQSSAMKPEATPAPSEAKPTEPAPTTTETVVTTTGVAIEPSLAEACDIDFPEAFFEFDAARLEAPAPRVLDVVVSCLKTGALANERVRLVGHTDPRGSQAYNMKLGMSRAESVAKYLEDHGISKDRVIVESVGKEHAVKIRRTYPMQRRVDMFRAAE